MEKTNAEVLKDVLGLVRSELNELGPENGVGYTMPDGKYHIFIYLDDIDDEKEFVIEPKSKVDGAHEPLDGTVYCAPCGDYGELMVGCAWCLDLFEQDRERELEMEQLTLRGDEARETAGEKRTEKEPFVKSVRDAVAHCCRELNRDEGWEPSRKESDFKAIFESDRFFGLYFYDGDNEYYLVEKESGAYNLVLGDSPDFVGRNFLKVLEGDSVIEVYDRDLLECLVNGVNENAQGFLSDKQLVGIDVLEKALEMVWVTVYKDVLGINDEKDNLTEISVPRLWLENTLKEQGVEDLEGWLDAYTADETEDIARMAMDGCLVQDCSDPNFGIGGIVDYHGHLCEVVSMSDGRAYLQDVNNDSHFEPTLEHFFRNAERVEEKDISKSALDCIETGDNKEDLLRAALEFYEYDVEASIQDPYFMKHADAFIYGHQEGVSDIDLDFWVQYEELLDEKLTYDEYRFVDGLYDGDPLELIGEELTEEEKAVFAEIKGKLAERRFEKTEASLDDAISAADDLKKKPTDIGQMPDSFRDLEF